MVRLRETNRGWWLRGTHKKEGIDYEKTFALVAHLEAIRILLAFSVAKGFKFYKMDVKSAFLNGVLQEEVYVRQPPGLMWTSQELHMWMKTTHQ
jgi:hypothetical protein